MIATGIAQWVGMLCLLLWGFWLCCKLRLPAGFAPLAGVSFAMVVLQLFGSVDQLWLGAHLLLVGAVLTLVHRKAKELRRELLAPGVLAFVTAAAVLQLAFALGKPEFQTWDEFSHWGIYFKSVFFQHRFAVWDLPRALAHPSYPQGIPALYALFAQMAACYRESDVLFVTALPLAAAAGALFAVQTPPGRAGRLIYTVCVCLAAPALFCVFAADTPYTTAYMDAPVGAMLGAGLLLCLPDTGDRDRLRRALAVGLVSAAASTVKEIGTVFALCILGVWFAQCLTAAVRRGGMVRRVWLPLGAAAALPAGTFVAWKVLLSVLHRGNDQFSSMGVGQFVRCFEQARSGENRYFFDVWDRYYARLRSYALLFGSSPLKIGCLCALAAVVLALALMKVLGRRRGLCAGLPGLCMILYWPLYHGVLFYVYICGMSAYEALRMASWDRYFCCFFIGWFVILAGEALLLGSRLPVERAARAGALLPAGLLACVGLWGLLGVPDCLVLPTAQWRAEGRQNAAVIRDKTAGRDEGQTIWLLSADGETAVETMWYYQYELYPALTAVEASPVQGDADLEPTAGEHRVGYLVLFGLDDGFARRTAALADDGLAAASSGRPAVYEVQRQADGIRLLAR